MPGTLRRARRSPDGRRRLPSKPTTEPAKTVEPDDEDSDDDDESEDAIESASDELSAAKAAEAKALSDEEELRTQRLVAPSALGPGNPLLGELNDLPDLIAVQAEADAREASQIARELEQFETFDAREAAAHYDIPVELNDQVSQYIRMFQGPLRSHFELWLSRSARYIPSMREALAREGVPEDTVFLSLIESGFNTLAYSVARAAGQWQFIASTGRRFGLHTDFWVDERRDPEKSTAAAAAYLKELRGQLGSWYLAWAGYNAGAGTIAKAIRRQHSADFWTLIRGRVLKRETKGYVPKLIAAALIAKHPHAFRIRRDLKYQATVPSETVQELPSPPPWRPSQRLLEPISRPSAISTRPCVGFALPRRRTASPTWCTYRSEQLIGSRPPCERAASLRPSGLSLLQGGGWGRGSWELSHGNSGSRPRPLPA